MIQTLHQIHLTIKSTSRSDPLIQTDKQTDKYTHTHAYIHTLYCIINNRLRTCLHVFCYQQAAKAAMFNPVHFYHLWSLPLDEVGPVGPFGAYVIAGHRDEQDGPALWLCPLCRPPRTFLGRVLFCKHVVGPLHHIQLDLKHSMEIHVRNLLVPRPHKMFFFALMAKWPLGAETVV